MELVARCSNLSGRLAALKRAAGPAPRAEDETAAAPRVHRLVDRLGQERAAEVAAAYQAGEPLLAIAKRFKISKPSVNDLAAQAGLPRRRVRLTQDRRDLAVELYRSGMSLAAVGQRLGCDPATVRNVLIAGGFERRDTQGQEPATRML